MTIRPWGKNTVTYLQRIALYIKVAHNTSWLTMWASIYPTVTVPYTCILSLKSTKNESNVCFSSRLDDCTFVFLLNCICQIDLFNSVTSEAIANVTPCTRRWRSQPVGQHFTQSISITIFIRLYTLKSVNFNPQSEAQIKPIFSGLHQLREHILQIISA